MTANSRLIGVDVGGTFTDTVVIDAENGEVLSAFKLPSTPSDPGAAVIAALRRVAGDVGVRNATVCHGTTVGTNTLIERQGAKVALLATSGFKDVIEIRRQNRPTLYDLGVPISAPLVPRHLRFGVVERIDAEGNCVTELEDTTALTEQLQRAEVTSVAIAFLHSYANPAHEKAVQTALERALPGIAITISSDVCPEFREFERTSTAVVNAYIAPAVGTYIQRVAAEAAAMGAGDLMVVKSNGGLTSPANAARYPVHLIESGPAAGMMATAAYARAIDRRKVIAFDMGGTTAKAGVIQDFKPTVADEFRADHLVNGCDVGGYPIRSAVLDIIEIGAGGGSIAWIDDGGVIKVGPKSAGADPGPACYSRGGSLPTVTDAHAVIGSLSETTFEGSGVVFDRELAVAAVEQHIARPMGWSVARAAHAIIALAVASMTEMVRLATVRRGLDPREFSIVAAGGAGPLHALAVGAEAGVKEVIVPPLPGMFSALGAILGEVRHDLSQTLLGPISELSSATLGATFDQLGTKALDLLAREPAGTDEPRLKRFADLRFAGQLFELRVALGDSDQPLPDADAIECLFRAEYSREFGFGLPDSVVQLVNLRLHASQSLTSTADRIFRPQSHGEGSQDRRAEPYRVQRYVREDDTTASLPVFRSANCIGRQLAGPLLIEHAGSTVWVATSQTAQIGEDGGVVFRLQEDQQ